PWLVVPGFGRTNTNFNRVEPLKKVSALPSPVPGWRSSIPSFVTVAVRVTACPAVAGLGETVRAVVLGVSRPSSASRAGTNVRRRTGAGRPRGVGLLVAVDRPRTEENPMTVSPFPKGSVDERPQRSGPARRLGAGAGRGLFGGGTSPAAFVCRFRNQGP